MSNIDNACRAPIPYSTTAQNGETVVPANGKGTIVIWCGYDIDRQKPRVWQTRFPRDMFRPKDDPDYHDFRVRISKAGFAEWCEHRRTVQKDFYDYCIRPLISVKNWPREQREQYKQAKISRNFPTLSDLTFRAISEAKVPFTDDARLQGRGLHIAHTKERFYECCKVYVNVEIEQGICSKPRNRQIPIMIASEPVPAVVGTDASHFESKNASSLI